MSEAYIFTEKLTVGYQKKPLIEDIDLSLKRGEILTLIGPNGAGKSTILKSLTRQLRPIAGTVYIDRDSLFSMPEKELAKKMSMMFTERIRTELMTCEDVVSAGRYPYTGKFGILSEKDRQAVAEAMELVHVTELAGRDFSQISDGQRQRVLLAKALCQEPEIILLDEPTSFLDIRHKLELLTILKQMVAEKNLAVILSLHEIDLAQKVSDLVACVHGDRVEKVGTPEEIFTAEYMEELYEMTKGSYNAYFGSPELEAVKGEPEVFVIGGGGSGIPVYRSLQRKGIPFAAGVLQENDLDYPVAAALASKVITEKAFEPVSEKRFLEALAVMKNCREVIVCRETFGTMNEKNEKLAAIAGKR